MIIVEEAKTDSFNHNDFSILAPTETKFTTTTQENSKSKLNMGMCITGITN